MNFNKLIRLYGKLPLTFFFKFVFADIGRRLFLPRSGFYFAQGAEDIILMYLIEKYEKGFYIDVGSNHPINYSNTFKLYLQGWNGILVDGNKDLIDKSKKIRKKDICVHGIVSNEKRTMDFHLAEESLMSSVDATHVKLTSRKESTRSFSMESITLNEIIEQYAPDKSIDLLSIDVEGHDFEVLQSIDLDRYKPSLIVVEDLNHHYAPLHENKYVRYLTPFKYQLAGMDKFNLFFLIDSSGI